jgi:hypothetical protein
MSGIFSKFSLGGGEATCHSSVVPPQGLLPALFPLKREVIRLMSNITRPARRSHEPIVEIRLPV